MKTKVVWSIISLLTAAVLLLASCGPKAAPAPAAPTPAPAAPTPATPAPAPTPAVPAPIPASTEKPKYGGTINVVRPSVTEKFDIAVSPG